jgi:hypothetical protein
MLDHFYCFIYVKEYYCLLGWGQIFLQLHTSVYHSRTIIMGKEQSYSCGYQLGYLLSLSHRSEKKKN